MGPSTVSRTFRLHAIRRRLQFPADVALLGANASVSHPVPSDTSCANVVVRNRAAIIRKAELTGDAEGLVSVSRRCRVTEGMRKREGQKGGQRRAA